MFIPVRDVQHCRNGDTTTGRLRGDVKEETPVAVGGGGHGVVDKGLLPRGFDAWGPEEDGETGLPTPDFPLGAEETVFEDGVGVWDCCAGFGAGGLP